MHGHNMASLKRAPETCYLLSDSLRPLKWSVFRKTMAVVLDIDAYSRRSRRHGTSGRRRTTTSYDKYGYQIATSTSSHSKGSEPVMHILRVRPGVVVNFVDAPSHSSRSSRSRTSSHTVERRPSTHKLSRKYQSDYEREPSWEMTHSPHPRALELFDDRPSKPFGLLEPDPPPPAPSQIVGRTIPTPPSPHLAPEPQLPPPLPIVRRSTPSPPVPHFFPNTNPPYDSHREPSAPIDIPIHSRSSDFTHNSPSTMSSTSVSPTHHEHAFEQYYHVPRLKPAPIDIPVQISSGRTFSRSFEYPSHSTNSSGSTSPPSTTRTVRFNDNPVQPSPSPVVRRKGWWNRRGDQLWDNDGAYAPAPEHDKYPLDLHKYPEPGVGWMNEDGVQIDTKRRLVRKKPLRSALKKPSPSP